MRCPACGATNSDRADWCTQCFRELRAAESSGPAATADAGGPASPPGPAGAASTSPPGQEGAAAASPPGPDAASPAEVGAGGEGDGATPTSTGQRDVRTVDGEVEWRCARCDAWNPLVVASCVTCGAERQGFGDPARPPAPDPAARTRLLVASAALPGLGHVLTRRTGSGVGRSILAVTWVLGAVLLATSGGAAASVAVLLFGAGIVWAGTLHDVLALFDGGRELLTSRALLWVTGAVIVTLLATLFLTTGTATGV